MALAVSDYGVKLQSDFMKYIQIQPLTAQAFAAFGEVIACAGNDFFHINGAHTERYHALSLAQAVNAEVGLSIFRNIQKTQVPCEIQMLERHPIGSQAFIPMQGQSFLVVVAAALDQDQPDLDHIYAFISNGQQAVNYRAGTWHHPLLTLEAPSDFTVIDRIGEGHNCDVFQFNENIVLTL